MSVVCITLGGANVIKCLLLNNLHYYYYYHHYYISQRVHSKMHQNYDQYREVHRNQGIDFSIYNYIQFNSTILLQVLLFIHQAHR